MKTFSTPDELWKYSLALASSMMVLGYREQSIILESRTKLTCTTGWEWLSEMSGAIHQIKKLGPLPQDIEEKLDIILATTKSEHPYGE